MQGKRRAAVRLQSTVRCILARNTFTENSRREGGAEKLIAAARQHVARQAWVTTMSVRRLQLQLQMTRNRNEFLVVYCRHIQVRSLQRCVRCSLTRMRFVAMIDASTRLATVTRMLSSVIVLQDKKRAAVRLQSTVRCITARNTFTENSRRSAAATMLTTAARQHVARQAWVTTISVRRLQLRVRAQRERLDLIQSWCAHRQSRSCTYFQMLRTCV